MPFISFEFKISIQKGSQTRCAKMINFFGFQQKWPRLMTLLHFKLF